jgi:hypothetical protein
MAGTMNWADVYGEEASPIQLAAPISAAGPYQSYVNPAFSGPGTGAMGGPVGKGPAISLIGIAAALILLRIAVEMGGEVA